MTLFPSPFHTLCIFSLSLLLPALSANTHSGKIYTPAVVSGSYEATKLGLEILKAGGNAADAAITVSLALGVSEPYGSGPGGKAAILYWDMPRQEMVFIEGLEAAAKTERVMDFRRANPTTRSSSYQSSATPGMIDALWVLHKDFGTMPWSDLVAPVAELARQGFIITDHDAAIFRSSLHRIRNDPETLKIFMPNGRPPEAGQRIKNPDMAATLDRLARNGRDEFYAANGITTRLMVAAMQRHNGFLNQEDFLSYEARRSEPLFIDWQGYRIYSSASPTTGGATLLLSLLAIEELLELDDDDCQSIDHLLNLALQSVYPIVQSNFADHENRYHDAQDTFSGPNIKRLQKEIFRKWEESSNRVNVRSGSAPIENHEQDTTHFIVVDQHGNVASVTQSLGSRFGSGIIIPGTGFFMNNSMINFALTTPRSPNYIQPGKRPRSTIAPTIVLKDDRPRMALGAPAGQRIPSGLLQVILHTMQCGKTAEEAILGPRFHLRRPLRSNESNRHIDVEDTVSPEWISKMEEKGWEVEAQPTVNHYYFGGINLLEWNEKGEVSGVADPRRSNYFAQP